MKLLPAHTRPVDAREQHRQIRGIDAHDALARLHLRQAKAAFLQAFAEKAKPAVRPPDHLEHLAFAAQEEVQMPGERILAGKAAAHLGQQADGAFAHVARRGGQEDPARWRQVQHETARAMAARSAPT